MDFPIEYFQELFRAIFRSSLYSLQDFEFRLVINDNETPSVECVSLACCFVFPSFFSTKLTSTV